MDRIRYLILAVALGCLITPAIGTASPVQYVGVGSVMGEQGYLLPIVGGVNIDDQLLDWSTGQPTEWQSDGGSYFYRINDYSLQVGQNSFSGGQGMLWLTAVRPPDDDWLKLDFVWFLEDGQGDWTEWTGEDFFFYNADLTMRDISEYGTLAEIINLVELAWLDYPIIADSPNFSLWLVQKDGNNPVPEPATMALLGAGAAGMFFHKRRTSRRREDAS